MTGFLETVAPRRLGSDFRWLLGASWLNSLGSGMALAAGPLLIASRTSDARLISLAVLLDWLPGMLFGLYAGVLSDRHNRRTMMVLGNVLRAIILVALVTMLVTHRISIVAVLVTMFVQGTSDTFSQAAGGAVLPMVVGTADLGVASSRFQFGAMGLNRLIGPPVGALLFGLGQALPFMTELICSGLAAVLLAQLVLPPHGTARHERREVRVEIREGWTWSWASPAMRTLNLQILAFNLAYGAVWSTMVLYAHRRLGLSAAGYGLLLASIAIGGVVGALSYGWVERHLRISTIMRAGLIWEVTTWGVLAWTDHWWVAFSALALFGVHEAYWGSIFSAIRGRIVPDELRGRVGAVYIMLLTGGLVIGAAIGGPLSHGYGLTAPYWFGFACAGVVLAVIWPQLRHLTYEAPQPTAEPTAGVGPEVQ
jgi:MFS family permease